MLGDPNPVGANVAVPRADGTPAAGTTTFEASMTVNIAGEIFTLKGTLDNAAIVVEYHAEFDKAVSLGSIDTIATEIGNALNFPELGNLVKETHTQIGGLPVVGGIVNCHRDRHHPDHRSRDQHRDEDLRGRPGPRLHHVRTATPDAVRHHPGLPRLPRHESEQGPGGRTQQLPMADVPMNGGSGQRPGAPRRRDEARAARWRWSCSGSVWTPRRRSGPGADTILSVRLGDLTLGELIRFLVDKAEPGLDVQLTPPWDFLNTINLHSFTFEVDLTRFRIGFRYDDIGFARRSSACPASRSSTRPRRRTGPSRSTSRCSARSSGWTSPRTPV